MLNRRFTCWLAGGALILGLTAAQTPTAFAKPDKPAKEMKDKPKRMMTLPKKLQESIEAKTGKPITDDQKSKINDALQTKSAAIKAANDKYNAELAGVVGITVEELEALMKPPKKEKMEKKAETTPAAADTKTPAIP